jgi:hypothetical protein
MSLKRTLFVGGASQHLAMVALDHDPTAWLLDLSNCHQWLDTAYDHDVTVYTSVSDIPQRYQTFWQILMSATEIVYVPETEWVSHNQQRRIYEVTDREQGLLESFVIQASYHRPVRGLEHINTQVAALDLAGRRCSEQPQLWAVGCSNTKGTGVEPAQTWAQQLCHKLSMPVTVLAKGGASMPWAADQIIRSDIRAGDIVVWALTSARRQNWFHENQSVCINALWYDEQGQHGEQVFPSRLLLGEHPVLASMQAVEQVKNFCRITGAKLYMFNTIPVDADLDQFVSRHSNFYHLGINFFINDKTGQRILKYIDLGNDNKHPGPQQHQHWANQLHKIIVTQQQQ